MAYNSLSVMGSPYYINNNINFRQRAKNVEENTQENENSKGIEPAVEENPSDAPKRDVYQRLAESKAEQKKAIALRDEHLKNATVNIAQMLKDFKNTGLAIGTPDDIMEDVNSYIELIKKQLSHDEPDTALIKSNFKSAASLLDKFISDTLQKPSKVVTNWLDAIFLQQVDYNYNEEQINPNFSVKFPAGSQQAKEQEQDNKEEEAEQLIQEKPVVAIPQDEELKSLFIKAKKYSFAKDYKTAMDTFKQALDRAIEIDDKETESKVLFEIGNIYDKNDYLAQALTSYNRSIKAASDMNVKSKAHFSMAQIYDDVSQFESAINHYMSSISYAGETENLPAQSASLVKIGNIYADTYKKDAFEYYSVAQGLANETSAHNLKGYVSSNIANAYNKFNEPKSALKYYSDAVLEYDKSESPKKVAINYKRAAEIMLDYDNPNKAKKLLHKALLKARQTDDIQLMNEIHSALENA